MATITVLKKNQIFVFGSNLLGAHGGGAAHQAKEFFGAKKGCGEGLTGRCYAFPSLDRNFHKRSWEDLEHSRDLFFSCAELHPDKEFLMTAVGTGIAGFSHEEMKSLFADPPLNVILPEEWR
jgi:hypothetical protein